MYLIKVENEVLEASTKLASNFFAVETNMGEVPYHSEEWCRVGESHMRFSFFNGFKYPVYGSSEKGYYMMLDLLCNGELQAFEISEYDIYYMDDMGIYLN